MALNNKLTLKQQRFADEYIISGNATEASIKAGYSAKTATETGYENLRKPHIKKYIEERTESIRSSNILTAAERMEILSKIALDKEARENDKIKAIDTLNKMDATYITQIDMTTNQNVVVTENPLKGLTTEELRKLADANDN